MRFSKRVIQQRNHGNLRVEFAHQDITSYSGLELFRRYVRLIDLHRRVQRSFRDQHLSGDYGLFSMMLVFFVLWLTGGRRLSHVGWISGDPLVERICALKNLPSDRSLSRWLAQFTHDSLQCLITLNSELVLEKMKDLDLPRITLDFDGTVVSCGDSVEGAARGYNPHNRHAKSYYPLLCHIAQTGHFLYVHHRPGNIHDSQGGALEIIQKCVTLLKQTIPGVVIEVRLDAAFFIEEIVRFLLQSRIDFAVKAPMWSGPYFKGMIQKRKRWRRASRKISWFEETIFFPKWKIDLHLVFYRIQRSEKGIKKTFQLDLFSPNDALYEYQILCTNKTLAAKNLLDFYNGRCGIERQIAELKGQFAFDAIPTQNQKANEAHHQLSAMGYNLVRNFQTPQHVFHDA